jgi:hypothetical protein
MRESNFIAFWVVFGFFMGLLASFYNWNDPFDILSGVIIVTFFFYLVAHVSVALFMRFMDFVGVSFDRREFDRKLDYFYNQMAQREIEIDAHYAFIAKEEEDLRQELQEQMERENAKRRRKGP